MGVKPAFPPVAVISRGLTASATSSVCSGQESRLILVHYTIKFYQKLLILFPILSIPKKYQNRSPTFPSKESS